MLSYWISQENPAATFLPPSHLVSLSFNLGLLEVSKKAFDDHVQAVFSKAEKENPWVSSAKLVCKPDQLIKRRGKNGLLGINLDWKNVKKWIAERAGSVIHVCVVDLI